MSFVSKAEYYQQQLQFEVKDRAISIGLGVGFLAMAGAGVWALATGEPIGILPGLAGAGFAAAEFYEAGKAS
jgi:hypothetical protein